MARNHSPTSLLDIKDRLLALADKIGSNSAPLASTTAQTTTSTTSHRTTNTAECFFASKGSRGLYSSPYAGGWLSPPPTSEGSVSQISFSEVSSSISSLSDVSECSSSARNNISEVQVVNSTSPRSSSISFPQLLSRHDGLAMVSFALVIAARACTSTNEFSNPQSQVEYSQNPAELSPIDLDSILDYSSYQRRERERLELQVNHLQEKLKAAEEKLTQQGSLLENLGKIEKGISTDSKSSASTKIQLSAPIGPHLPTPASSLPPTPMDQFPPLLVNCFTLVSRQDTYLETNPDMMPLEQGALNQAFNTKHENYEEITQENQENVTTLAFERTLDVE